MGNTGADVRRGEGGMNQASDGKRRVVIGGEGGKAFKKRRIGSRVGR